MYHGPESRETDGIYQFQTAQTGDSGDVKNSSAHNFPIQTSTFRINQRTNNHAIVVENQIERQMTAGTEKPLQMPSPMQSKSKFSSANFAKNKEASGVATPPSPP